MAERQIGHQESCLVLSTYFPFVKFIYTDIPVLLLNQPSIVMVGIRGQQGMPSQLYMPLLAFPPKLG